MAIKITDECINCGACEPECPNNAIYEGGIEWKMADGKIIYYNGIPTIKQKVALAHAKASGIMIWQIQGDASGSKSLLKAINKEAYKVK